MRAFTLICCLVSAAALSASDLNSPGWSGIDIRLHDESAVLSRLEGQGVPCIGDLNAVVEISAFEGLEEVPLAGLEERLAPSDPRWDPWLRSLPSVFQASPQVAIVYVPREQKARALTILGAQALPGQGGLSGPRVTTAWLFALAALAGGLILGGVALAERRVFWTRGMIAASSAVGVGLVIALLLVAVPHRSKAPGPKSPVWSWVQHRWFQESWPYGARWADWKWNVPWKYPAYEREGRRIVAGETILPVPNDAWLRECWDHLSPDHAARVLGLHHP